MAQKSREEGEIGSESSEKGDLPPLFLPPLVGCLVKKRLQKTGSHAPQDPPSHAPAYALVIDFSFGLY